MTSAYQPDPCCENFLQIVDQFICVCEDGIIVWINDSGLRLLRAPNPDSVVGNAIANFVDDDFSEFFVGGLDMLAGENQAVPINMLTVDAAPLKVKLSVTKLPETHGAEKYFVQCQDISNIIDASEATRSREQRLAAVLKAVNEAVISIDELGIIKDINVVATKVFGYTKPEMLGQNVSMLMPEPHRANHDQYLVRYLETGHSRMIDQTNEVECVRSDGEIFPAELTVTEITEKNDQKIYLGSIRDVTVKKAQEERIRFLALNDALTGLPNRASFNDKIDDAVARAKRNKSGIALMFIDLDKFKPINDELGHEAGDLVLKTVAERLCANIRATDTAARMGGDEFVVILDGIPKKEDAKVIAELLLAEVPKPIAVDDVTCSVGLSIGISHFPTDAETVPALLHAADQAMYKVKAAGRNNFAFC